MFTVGHKRKFMDMLIPFMVNLSLLCDKISTVSNLGAMYKEQTIWKPTNIESS